MSSTSSVATTTANFSNASLIAVLLITRTRAGPRLLLHYPPSCSGLTPFSAAAAAPTTEQDETAGDARRRSGTGSKGTPSTRTRSPNRVKKLGKDEQGRRTSHRLTQEEEQEEHLGIDSEYEDEPHDNDTRNDSGQDESGTAPSTLSPSASTVTPSQLHTTAPPPSRGSFQPPLPQPSTPANNETWSHVLSFPADGLAKMLAPTGRKSWHKRKLEVCLGGMWFVGCPIHEKEEGGWVGKKGKRGRAGKHEGKDTKNGRDRQIDGDGQGDDKGEDSEGDIELEPTSSIHLPINGHSTSDTKAPATSSTARAIATPTPPPSDPTTSTSPNGPADASTSFTTTTTTTTTSSTPSSNAPNTTVVATPDTLTMFNIVFVLAPSTSSTGIYESTKVAGITVEEVYTHCAKKLSKVLEYRQKRSGFVWEDVRRIMSGRIAAREGGLSYAQAWPHLSTSSSLARSLASAYHGLTTSRVAHINLGSNAPLSLKLPQQTSTSHIPTPTSPILMTPGLWLTTFCPYPLDRESPPSEDTQGTISPHSALLLLAPVEMLLKEIGASSPPLAYYIRHLLPTKTLLQMSRKSRLSLQKMQLLSLHLVEWRRARAISPLHHTNIYIVSPLADWDALETASAAFRARFAALPSLPSTLARLSATLSSTTQGKGMQPWGRFMPSPDHKEAYMEMLEWLVRGGWVTQLRTFAWVMVSRSVKVEVARKLKIEERDASNPVAVDESEEGEADETTSVNGSAAEKRRHSSQGSTSLLSPRLKPHLFQTARRSSDAGSFTSVSTALRVPVRSNMRLDPSSAAHPKHGRPHRLSDVSINSKILLDEKAPPEVVDIDVDSPEFEPSIVLSPHKANALESKWLEHIGINMPDADIREVWPRLLKYFDGNHAVEEIAIQEGLKRKILSPMLSKLMGDSGVLKTVRHW